MDGEAAARLEHDLNTPLSVISGYAELLRLRDDERTRIEAAKAIEEAVERLRALVAEVVALAGQGSAGERAADEPA